MGISVLARTKQKGAALLCCLLGQCPSDFSSARSIFSRTLRFFAMLLPFYAVKLKKIARYCLFRHGIQPQNVFINQKHEERHVFVFVSRS